MLSSPGFPGGNIGCLSTGVPGARVPSGYEVFFVPVMGIGRAGNIREHPGTWKKGNTSASSLSVRLSVGRSVCLSVFLICLSFYLSVNLSVYLSVLSVCLLACLCLFVETIYQAVYLPVFSSHLHHAHQNRI